MLSQVSVNTLALADLARVFARKNTKIYLYVEIITLLDWLRVEYIDPKVEAQGLIKKLLEHAQDSYQKVHLWHVRASFPFWIPVLG